MNDERFCELLEGFVDGTLDDEASRELLVAFAADADLKGRFLNELRLQNSLCSLPLLEGETRSPRSMEALHSGVCSRDLRGGV